METIPPAWALVTAAGRFLAEHRQAFLRNVAPGAVMVGIVTGAIHALAGRSAASAIAATFAVLLFQIYFAEYWMHETLRAAPPPPLGRLATDQGQDQIHYAVFFRYGLLLASAFAVVVGPIGVVMNLTLEAGIWGIGPDIPGLRTFLFGAGVIGPVFLFAIGRLLLVFPARAVDIPLTLGQSWTLAAPLGLRIFATQILCAAAGIVLFALALAVPWLFLALMPGWELTAAGLQAAAVAALTAVYIALSGYCLSLLFRGRWLAAHATDEGQNPTSALPTPSRGR